MRYSFTKKDVLFLRKRLARAAREERKKKDEERGRRHSNTSYCSSVWLKVEGRGKWAVYSSRNTSLDSPPIVVCVCFSGTRLVRFMTGEGSSYKIPLSQI